MGFFQGAFDKRNAYFIGCRRIRIRAVAAATRFWLRLCDTKICQFLLLLLLLLLLLSN
jgi:hypothetical protein